MDQITNLLDQLYRPQISEDDHQSSGSSSLNQLEHVLPSEDDATMDENFSQFSDNAVLSPPMTNNQQVLPTASSIITDDEHLIFTGRETMMTAGSGCSTITSSQPSAQDVTELESPDIENQTLLPQPLKEVDERTADTVIIASEDASESSQERPFKMTTPGLY